MVTACRPGTFLPDKWNYLRRLDIGFPERLVIQFGHSCLSMPSCPVNTAIHLDIFSQRLACSVSISGLVPCTSTLLQPSRVAAILSCLEKFNFPLQSSLWISILKPFCVFEITTKTDLWNKPNESVKTILWHLDIFCFKVSFYMY